eukprot:172905-Chlamydomonas_euryale.AAC.1
MKQQARGEEKLHSACVVFVVGGSGAEAGKRFERETLGRQILRPKPAHTSPITAIVRMPPCAPPPRSWWL